MADVIEMDAVSGVVIERDYTPAEAALAAADAIAAAGHHDALVAIAANRDTLQQQATTALAQNRAAIAAAPASVTLRQAVDQIQRLSAQNNALIRLVLGLLDATD
jgi:DNA-binding LytR/AlgR family response regulator